MVALPPADRQVLLVQVRQLASGRFPRRPRPVSAATPAFRDVLHGYQSEGGRLLLLWSRWLVCTDGHWSQALQVGQCAGMQLGRAPDESHVSRKVLCSVLKAPVTGRACNVPQLWDVLPAAEFSSRLQAAVKLAVAQLCQLSDQALAELKR